MEMKMTENDKPKFWFPKKKYGYGWGAPNCWQGWVVLLGFIGTTLSGRVLISGHGVGVVITYYIGLSAALIAFVFLKGEK